MIGFQRWVSLQSHSRVFLLLTLNFPPGLTGLSRNFSLSFFLSFSADSSCSFIFCISSCIFTETWYKREGYARGLASLILLRSRHEMRTFYWSLCCIMLLIMDPFCLVHWFICEVQTVINVINNITSLAKLTSFSSIFTFSALSTSPSPTCRSFSLSSISILSRSSCRSSHSQNRALKCPT